MLALGVAACLLASHGVGDKALRAQGALRLGPFLEVFAEPADAPLRPEDAFTDPRFVHAEGDEPSFGTGQRILWARFRTERDLPPLVLRAGHPRPQRIDVFARRPDGTVLLTAALDLQDAETHRGLLLDLAVPLDPGAREHAVRFVARPARLNLELLPESRLEEVRERELLWNGMYYGVFIGLLLYNFLFGVALRAGVYFLYCALQIALVMHVAVRDGLAPWPLPVPLFERGGSIAIANFLMLAFARSFLDLRTRRPRYDAVAKVALAAQLLLFLGAVVGIDVYALAVALVVPSLFVVTFAAAAVARTGVRSAAWLLFAWSILFASIVWNVALAMGVFDGGITTHYSLKIGSAIEIIVLSLAVASRLEGLREEKERAERALADTRMQSQRELARRLIEAQEAERARFARELHDGLGHALLSVKERLLAAARRARQLDAAEAEALAGEAQRCLDDARAMARNLVPADLEHLGLSGALRAAGEELSRRTGVRVEVNVQPGAEMSPERSVHLFRIAQEAMSNAIRHAHASKVDVTLQHDNSALSLSIEDDGCGFDVRAPRGLGLLDMEQRARIAGGRLDLKSERAGGTCITCSVPMTRVVGGDKLRAQQVTS